MLDAIDESLAHEGLWSLRAVALDCLSRAWYVFPCYPESETPLTRNGFKDATKDPQQIRALWALHPRANVGIATGASGLTVLDVDSGLEGLSDYLSLCGKMGIDRTYTVRTGRRPGFGVQMYFTGPPVKSIAWESEGCEGDIRSSSGYVMAAGSIHPDSKEPYEVLVDAPLEKVSGFVARLLAARLRPKPVTGLLGGKNAVLDDDGGAITSHRNVHMISLLGRFRGEGNDDAAVEEFAHRINEERMSPPLGESEIARLIQNACKFPLPEAAPEILIGGRIAGMPEPPRPKFLTLSDFDNAEPPSFLIEGFLVKDAMCMLAGPVAQRKTIVAMNVVHALCTGEPLFGHFKVTTKPERVYYLCPEMGASSFCKRLRQLGLRNYIGKSLFCLTLNQPPIDLEDLEDLAGSVVVVDTLTRYVQGNENDSTDMRAFAQRVMGMNRAGATVVLLHHSTKGSSGTLDSALRGSSELAAFVTSCWVTALEDAKDPYKTRSTMANVKQRDFESEPFFLLPMAGSFRLEYGGKDEPEAKVGMRQKASDEAEVDARELFDADPKISIRVLRAALSERGHRKGTDWVRDTLIRFKDTGVTIR